MNEKTKLPGAQPGAQAAGAEPAPSAQGETQAKLEQLIEQIVARQLNRARQELEERVTQARGEGRAEAERLAGMSEEERRRYRDEAERAREAELNRREAELNRRELRGQVADELAARGLPRELAELIDCGDASAAADGVDALERAFREAVQRGVDERINRGRPLPRGTSDAQTGIVQRMRAAAGLNDK